MFKNEEYSSFVNIFAKNQIYNLIDLQVLYPHSLPDKERLCVHRDYKRIKAASGDELRNKLNKSNGGGANLSPGCTPMKINIFGFCLFL